MRKHHDELDLRAPRVRQAARVISQQLDCDTRAAVELLVIQSCMIGQEMEYTALDVLDGEIRFNSSVS